VTLTRSRDLVVPTQERRENRWLSPGLLLAVVAIAYALLQLGLFHLHRGLEYDEAVYLSEAVPSLHSLGFAASRSRGIVALIEPLAVFSAPLVAIRLYLIAASSLALYVAFRIWVPLLRRGAVAGAALFAFAWPTLFYGSEISPNLWSALAGVAAAGALARALQDGRRRWLVSLATAFAVMAFMRHIDAALAAFGAAVVIIPIYRRKALPAIGAIAIGGSVGVAPWVVEALVRWGSIGRALTMAQAAVSGTGRGRPVILEHLFLTDGPIFSLDPVQKVPAFGAGWWLGLVILSVVAVVSCARGARAPVLVLVSMGVAVAAFYLTFAGAFAPRFILPAYGFMSLAAGAAFHVVRDRPPIVRRSLFALGGAAILIWGVWSVGTAHRIETQQVALREVAPTLAGEIRDIAGPHCSFASQYGRPQVQVYSSCTGITFVPGSPLQEPVDVVLTVLPPEKAGVADTCPSVRHSAVPGWYIYVCSTP
jgi:hypothetical protein